MRLIISLTMLAFAGCTAPSLQGLPMGTAPVMPAPTLDPTPPLPPAGATTPEQFDTTSAADRAAAVAAQTATGEVNLGTTIASLGPPAEPGIWLKTPLVTALARGRVVYKGKSVNVELRPSGGVVGAGSQISLAAMRLIEAPLTGLPEVMVFLY